MTNKILFLFAVTVFTLSSVTAQDDCAYSLIYSVENDVVNIEVENLIDVSEVTFTIDGQTILTPSDILSLSISSFLQPAHICVEFYSPLCNDFIQLCQLIDISFLINISISDGCTDITLIDPDSDCEFTYDPVCGCNGITYINSCEATNYGGVISWSIGPCDIADTNSGDNSGQDGDTEEEETEEEETEEEETDDDGWWHGDQCDEECDGNCWWNNDDGDEDDGDEDDGDDDDGDDDGDDDNSTNNELDEGCYDVNGVLYSLGETYEVSEEFCENYTCVYWFGYQFVQNWEVYPDCQQTDEIINGCTILEACNFNPLANQNDGTCEFISCLDLGCTDVGACNYDPSAEYEDGSCEYPEIGFDCEENIEGCFDDNGSYYPIGSEWFISDCEFYVCDDVNNWSDIQTIEDCVFDCNVEIMMTQSADVPCLFEFSLMTDSEFIDADGNLLAEIIWDFGDGGSDFESGMQAQHLYQFSGIYNVTATYWNFNCGLNTVSTVIESVNCGECLVDSDGDGICDEFEIIGCTIIEACNYNPDATESDNSSCDFISCLSIGCTDPFACNYDPTADYEDGSCQYPEIGFDCEENIEGCLNENGSYYPVGSEWFISDCEFYVCDDVNNWSEIQTIENCLGCFDEFGVFYNLGQELFLDSSGCAFIFCETPDNWSDIVVVPNCDGLGCYDVNGNLYLNNEELIINEDEACDNLTCVQSEFGFEFVPNSELYPDCISIECDFTLDASVQPDVPCNLNWLFQLNGIVEETDNIFWDFGDGTTSEAGWTTEHIYDTEGTYIVTAFVFTPTCQLVTVVLEITIDGCDDEEELGCYDNSGVFYDIGSEWFLSECEYFYCESPGTWSVINVIDNCLGCFDELGVFYDLGSEIFVSDDYCSFIFCESPGVWSDTIYIPDCEGSGCFSDEGVFYEVGEDFFLNDCEYIYCEAPGNWSAINVISGCEFDCDFTLDASVQPDVPCNLNWLFQLNGIVEETDNIFWDFGDGTTSEAGWTTEHIYDTEGTYIVTAFVFTPTCQLVTVVLEITIDGCDDEEELGCYDEDNLFYLVGDILIISDDFCENYTCTIVDPQELNIEFLPNWEIYPECYQTECVNLDQINENISCPYVYSPVCGCNGMTYNNECEAFFYGGVTEWTDGPCEEPTEDCEIFFEWYINPNGVFVAEAYGYPEGTYLSWWVNGNEISNGENDIEYNMSNLLEPLEICVGGDTEDCDGFEYCETIFPIIEDYGCYEGGQFYPVGFTLYLNDCEYLICEGVDNWSDVMEIEGCGDVEDCIDESVIDPQMACYDVWDPVCGCDGVTYSNDCYAYYYHGVTAWTEGECGGSNNDCDIALDGWYQDGYGVFEAYNYPEGVNLHWWINGENVAESTDSLTVEDLEDWLYDYYDVVDICVGYFYEDCGEVYECIQIDLNNNPENPCPLEMWSGVQDGLAMFEAYEYPDGASLFWMIDGEFIENEGHYLEIDLNLIDVDFIEVCVGYETEDCPFGVSVCELVEVATGSGGEDNCLGVIDVLYPVSESCEFAFEIYGIDQNSQVLWDFGDGTEGLGTTSESYSYINDGTYLVSATYYTEDCPDGDTLILTVVVNDCEDSSTEEVIPDSWTVYPIPTSDNLTVVGLPKGTWSAKIFDAAGRIVFMKDVGNGSQIDLKSLGSGMYNMQILGLTTSAKRIVVQR